MQRFEYAPTQRKDAFAPPEPFPYRPNNTILSARRAADQSLAKIETVLADSLGVERQTRPETIKTANWVTYFDNNWQKEGLPHDWYRLRAANSQKVGFMMNRELDMLEDPYNKDHLADWTQHVKRNLEGFKLEFLTDKVVYPREYVWNKKEPSRLEDPLYGKTKDGKNFVDIAETISDQERNGSVKRAVQRAKEFLQTAPEGAMTLVTSPMGETGLTTDEGELIKYGDSYVFALVNLGGGKVMNYTLKTDLPLEASREALFQFSGIQLPDDAPIDWYVNTIANINPGEHKTIKSVDDVIDVLSRIQPSHAFLDKCTGQSTSWAEMKHQVAKGEELYKFDRTTQIIIDEFEAFATQGIYSKDMLRKGIAASILQMGDMYDKEIAIAKLEKAMQEGNWYDVSQIQRQVSNKSFREILEQTAARPGCAGGGQAIIVETMGGKRIVIRAAGIVNPGEDGVGKLQFTCTDGHSNTRKPGEIKDECKYPGCEKALC